MPKLDGTGPQGRGSRTGRGIGNCPGTGGNRQGLGFGRGIGRGLGRCHFSCPFWNNQQVSNSDWKKVLIEEKEIIEKELADLENEK